MQLLSAALVEASHGQEGPKAALPLVQPGMQAQELGTVCPVDGRKDKGLCQSQRLLSHDPESHWVSSCLGAPDLTRDGSMPPAEGILLPGPAELNLG